MWPKAVLLFNNLLRVKIKLFQVECSCLNPFTGSFYHWVNVWFWSKCRLIWLAVLHGRQFYPLHQGLHPNFLYIQLSTKWHDHKKNRISFELGSLYLWAIHMSTATCTRLKTVTVSEAVLRRTLNIRHTCITMYMYIVPGYKIWTLKYHHILYYHSADATLEQRWSVILTGVSIWFTLT